MAKKLWYWKTIDAIKKLAIAAAPILVFLVVLRLYFDVTVGWHWASFVFKALGTLFLGLLGFLIVIPLAIGLTMWVIVGLPLLVARGVAKAWKKARE